MLGGLLLVTVLGLLAWNRISSLQGKLENLEQVNKTQKDSLDLLKKSGNATSEVMVPMLEKFAATEKRLRTMQSQLTKLAETNETIKNFLAGDVPADIGGMLNDARTRTSSATISPSGTITRGQ